MARKRHGQRRRPKANPRGVLTVTPDGLGFVTTAEGQFFIPAAKLGGGFDGDIVEVAPAHINYDHTSPDVPRKRTGQRPTARVVSVVSRAHEEVVGRYEVADPFGVVVPADPRIPYDIFTMRTDRPDIPDGAIVRVRMQEFPSRNSAATGVIVDVLGMDGDTRMDIEAVIGRHKLEVRFSEAALAEAESVRVDEQGALAAGYKDLRGRCVFTIDPADARDFDDALSCEDLGGGRVRVGVHIADVAHYVRWGGAVDMDARRRATSVYLADRVLPMLPESLSNGVCSLVPHEPRRTMTVDMVLDASAQVQSVGIYEAVIESRHRFTYEEVQEILTTPAAEGDWCGCDPETLYALHGLDHVAQTRATTRETRGGIDFGGREAKVILDDAGEPTGVHIREKTRATQLVEEAMILANECVARRLLSAQMPAIFRVHDAPEPGNLADLVPVLQEFGYDKQVSLARFCQGDPHTIGAVLAHAQGRPEDELLSNLVLRAMQRAVYAPENRGHYGLALDAYLHFTSPIRRYPDLVAHRACKALLHGRGETFTAQADSLAWLADHASNMERVADSAARESQELMLVQLMAQHVGEAASGVVSGVAPHGLYVRLENTCEGVIPIRDLGEEYFVCDTARHTLAGEDSGRTFRLGQRVAVRIHAAPAHARKLSLRLA